MQQQQRFVLFLIISAALIFGWSYLFPTQNPQQNQNSNSTARQTESTVSQVNSAAPQSTPVTDSQLTPGNSVASQPSMESTPPRTLTVTTPLYEAKMSSQGATATSWIIKKNKDTGRELFSASSTKQNRHRLELISQEGLKRAPDEAPLRLVTEDIFCN